MRQHRAHDYGSQPIVFLRNYVGGPSSSALGSLHQHTCKRPRLRNSGYGDILNTSSSDWKQRGQNSLAVAFEMQRRWHAVSLTSRKDVPKLATT